jgi:hypothetical protein
MGSKDHDNLVAGAFWVDGRTRAAGFREWGLPWWTWEAGDGLCLPSYRLRTGSSVDWQPDWGLRDEGWFAVVVM